MCVGSHFASRCLITNTIPLLGDYGARKCQRMGTKQTSFNLAELIKTQYSGVCARTSEQRAKKQCTTVSGERERERERATFISLPKCMLCAYMMVVVVVATNNKQTLAAPWTVSICVTCTHANANVNE